MKTHLIALLACCSLLPFQNFAQDAEIFFEEPETLPEEEPKTSLKFDISEYDFGKIAEDEEVSHVFKFTNTGEHPLIISEARGSCGCTVPFFPKVPIMPGESSEIEVAFDPKGKSGVQRKTVTIRANTSPALTTVNIVAQVLIPETDTAETEEETVEILREIDKKAIEAVNPNCMAIFPNPTNETLQLELKDHIGMTAMVEIHSKMGQKILSKEIEHISRETTRFDVSAFTPGMYLITIRISNYQPITQCFVVTGK